MDMTKEDRELDMLRLRNAIADKEWAIACANHDSVAYAAWKTDFYAWIADAQQEINWLLHKLKVDEDKNDESVKINIWED